MEDPALSKLIENLKRHPWLVHYQLIPAMAAKMAPMPEPLRPEIADGLRSFGIESLYSHQAKAFSLAESGKNVVIVTPTASGKTLCYNLPVLNRIAADPESRAAFLFPTKALSRDQMAGLLNLSEASGIHVKCDVYDGDTPGDTRGAIRKNAQVLITNPDMIHQAILPHHPKWKQALESLKYIVIDEMHTYTGVFGSHFANVIRRLKRICRFYGADPVFICCSATIANPLELAEELCEEKFTLIDETGAPSSAKHFFLVNPPIVNPDLGIRKSYIETAVQFMMKFIEHDISAIGFARTRLAVEVLTKYLKDRAPVTKKDSITGYRGGYLPGERRKIEKAVRSGQLKFILSTNALELGIDIGTLQGSVLAGYPGTIASTLQQSGRAGRKEGDAVSVLIASNLPVDQFIVGHPDYLFGRSAEHGRINPDNPEILFSHLACAAFELPVVDGEKLGTVSTGPAMEQMADMELVNHFGDKWHWIGDSYPAAEFSLRSVTNENFVVIDKSGKGNRVIAEVDYTAAHTTLYEQAIYMLQGGLYQVEELDYENRKAYVRKVQSDYYTDAIDHTHLNILAVERTLNAGFHQVNLGDVHVLTRVTGYKKIKFYTNENVGYGEVKLPDLEIHTSAFWVTLSEELQEQLGICRTDFTETLSGLLYALKTVSAIHLMSNVRDLGSAMQVDDTVSPQQFSLFIYDRYPGGIGLSNELFQIRSEIFEAARKLVQSCRCDSGCPSCIGSRTSETGNIKSNAVALLALLAARDK
ncbi:MAG: ATP-dependent helicase [Acidobacteria bacterium]|nr:MAG: ATP-dependent helicase [Acidobacteriota bacterium]RLE23479.1 MAG: ATP-dependent helicase [Acidobacteriota bacterium]